VLMISVLACAHRLELYSIMVLVLGLIYIIAVVSRLGSLCETIDCMM